jgi:hypothetical protein
METTYTIEFMRLAEPPLAPIKHPSAFHVAYYCTAVRREIGKEQRVKVSNRKGIANQTGPSHA